MGGLKYMRVLIQGEHHDCTLYQGLLILCFKHPGQGISGGGVFLYHASQEWKDPASPI